MPLSRSGFRPAVLILLGPLVIAQLAFAGVSRPIQDKYRRNYDNKAFFLKIPLYAERQTVFITGHNIRAEQGPGPARVKVGEQVRVVGIDFGGEEIKFKVSPISGAALYDVIFKFDAPLQEEFPNSSVFDDALGSTFTEGLKYEDIEDAKKTYVEDQFERVVREMATTSGTSREAVLKNIAPRLPAYQDAMRDIDNLKARSQELSTQVAQLQSDKRKLEGELKAQQNEDARLRSANAALQEKIDSSTAQLSRLGDDLRSARGLTQGYQKELANLQRTLNLKVDANRDLGSQISDLAQAMRKLQNENEALGGQVSSLRTNVEGLQTANAKLTGDLEDTKTANRKLKETIDTLTSKEDSLARQYIQLKNTKDNLETLAQSIDSLSTRIAEESSEGGFRSGKLGVYLKSVLLGTLEFRIPEYLNVNEEKGAEARFLAESIDYVKISPDERNLLHSLGDKLKLQMQLASPVPTILVTPETKEAQQEIGERDQAAWRWRVANKGTKDSRLVLDAHLINKNSDDIPVLTHEYLVTSSSVVRQIRGYLQPVPVAVGAVMGFVLFGVVGVFRRSKKPDEVRRKPPEVPYTGKKQL